MPGNYGARLVRGLSAADRTAQTVRWLVARRAGPGRPPKAAARRERSRAQRSRLDLRTAKFGSARDASTWQACCAGCRQQRPPRGIHGMHREGTASGNEHSGGSLTPRAANDARSTMAVI
jgi:hypothetical protein